MKLPPLTEKVGQMRLAGKTNAEVRDTLEISESTATRLWREYREHNKLPPRPVGPSKKK